MLRRAAAACTPLPRAAVRAAALQASQAARSAGPSCAVVPGQRGFSTDGGGGPGQRDRQTTLAKAYLKEYIKAKNCGDIQGAMRYLEKATVAAKHVHVWIPNQGADGSETLVPLQAIVPSFSYDKEEPPRFVLPISVDHSPAPDRQGTAAPDPAASPKTLLVSFGPTGSGS
mmetsp:Transcript_9119/g.26946  ORF Transcript_9119/g.26946 Transcript_9119/m.26946 type:complete len:171 (+) Transcript_9119:84-596(+)